MTTLIPIGRFARLTRLSVKALRLYDEMRLLVPAHVDASTGYRYYTRAQTKRAVIIGALRAVEMPLAEIHAFVETADDAAADQWLLTHRQRIAQRLDAHRAMLALIDAYVGNKPSLGANEIELVDRETMLVASVRVRTTRRHVAADIAEGFACVAQGLRAHALTPNGAPMLIHHDFIDEENEGDIEIAVPIQSWQPAPPGAANGGLQHGTLPACRLATIVHRGPFAEVASAYQRLFEWVSEQAIDITGPVREVYLTDPATIAPEHLLTRIELPVEAAPPRPCGAVRP